MFLSFKEDCYYENCLKFKFMILPGITVHIPFYAFIYMYFNAG